jgi:hypothetical protein
MSWSLFWPPASAPAQRPRACKPLNSTSDLWGTVPRRGVLFWLRRLFRFLLLDPDTEYYVEPHRRSMLSRLGSSTRDGAYSGAVPAGLYRSRTSLGGASSVSPADGSGSGAEWQIPPEDIAICKDPYGRDWQLGTGGFGSVRQRPCSCT